MVVDELLKLVAHVARTHVGRVGHYRGVLAGEVAGLGEDEVGTFGVCVQLVVAGLVTMIFRV